MRFTLVDVAIAVACSALGRWGASRVLDFGRGIGPIRELRRAHPAVGVGLFLLLMAALGIAAFVVLGSLLYRALGLLPLRLPACPHCGRLPHGYRVQGGDRDRARFVCGLCERATDIWWRRPDPATLDRSLPNLVLCWPESVGRWRLVASDPPRAPTASRVGSFPDASTRPGPSWK